MAIGIYKPGQGYWVRVLTAVAAGLLVLATAAWLWKETAALDLPSAAWDVTLTGSSGAPTVGQRVEVLGRPDGAGAAQSLGTMEVAAFTPSEFRPQIRLVKPQLNEGAVPSAVQTIRAEGFSGEVAGEGSGVRPIPIVDRLYVQGGLAGLALLLGSALVFWLVGSRPSSSEFLIATDGEMKKVNWSTRREILGSTWVVIAASFLVAAALYVIDLAFQWFFVSIDVLQR
ncbi:MAG TPA: preprotein translocase subunit SecE [Phycisphaerales bacterium]|nr:preprotein translocase subunit SecE [Phycisphaerales bacterium]